MFEQARALATVAVKDVDRAKDFYGGTLGLKPMDERSGGIRYETGGGSSVLVYPSQFAGSQATVCTFEVPDLEVAMKELRDRGVSFEEYDFPGLKTVAGIAEMQGARGAWFKDPDGNILALGQPT